MVAGMTARVKRPVDDLAVIPCGLGARTRWLGWAVRFAGEGSVSIDVLLETGRAFLARFI